MLDIKEINSLDFFKKPTTDDDDGFSVLLKQYEEKIVGENDSNTFKNKAIQKIKGGLDKVFSEATKKKPIENTSYILKFVKLLNDNDKTEYLEKLTNLAKEEKFSVESAKVLNGGLSDLLVDSIPLKKDNTKPKYTILGISGGIDPTKTKESEKWKARKISEINANKQKGKDEQENKNVPISSGLEQAGKQKASSYPNANSETQSLLDGLHSDKSKGSPVTAVPSNVSSGASTSVPSVGNLSNATLDKVEVIPTGNRGLEDHMFFDVNNVVLDRPNRDRVLTPLAVKNIQSTIADIHSSRFMENPFKKDGDRAPKAAQLVMEPMKNGGSPIGAMATITASPNNPLVRQLDCIAIGQPDIVYRLYVSVNGKQEAWDLDPATEELYKIVDDKKVVIDKGSLKNIRIPGIAKYKALELDRDISDQYNTKENHDANAQTDNEQTRGNRNRNKIIGEETGLDMMNQGFGGNRPVNQQKGMIESDSRFDIGNSPISSVIPVNPSDNNVNAPVDLSSGEGVQSNKSKKSSSELDMGHNEQNPSFSEKERAKKGNPASIGSKPR